MYGFKKSTRNPEEIHKTRNPGPMYGLQIHKKSSQEMHNKSVYSSVYVVGWGKLLFIFNYKTDTIAPRDS